MLPVAGATHAAVRWAQAMLALGLNQGRQDPKWGRWMKRGHWMKPATG